MSQLKVNILVVEDNLQDFIIIKEVLGQIRDFFLHVEHAENIADALDKINHSAKTSPFDIVFLDLFLPDSYGQETFKLVQESLVIAPPIVVLSGLSDKNIAMEIVKQGAQDYLVKGEFDSNLLEKSILYSIERKKYQDTLRRSEKKFRSTFESVAIGIGEYDYSPMFKKVKELKDQGVPHPSTKAIVTDENSAEWRKLLIGMSMNPEALKLFGFKDYDEYTKKAHGIDIVQKAWYFNAMAIAIWDQESTIEIQVDYNLPQGKLETLKQLRFLGDDSGFQRLLISTVDVTELKDKERKVKQQSTILNLIADCSTILLREESITNCKDQLLELVGTTLEADVAALFQTKFEANGFNKRAEWSKSGPEHFNTDLVFTTEYFEKLAANLKNGEVTKVIPQRLFEEPELNLFLAKDDTTTHVIPIKRIDVLEGVLVVSRGENKTDFSDFEIEGMNTIAKNIGSAIERYYAREDLQKANDNLEFNVKERTSELNEAIKDLESFSYSISHDLKAPLRTVNNFSDVLMEDFLDDLDPRAQKYLTNVQKGAQTMSNLIEALLRFSRTGTKKLVVSELNIKELVEDVCEELKVQVPNRKISVNYSGDPYSQGDYDLVRQVFTNFIWNAIKFTSNEPHAQIDIKAKSLGTLIEFSVQDNGVGFDMEYADKIFGVFQRLHSADQFQGTGVGLAIVQRIVSRHGGKVAAYGEVDKGAKFTFTLPAVGSKVSIEPTPIEVI